MSVEAQIRTVSRAEHYQQAEILWDYARLDQDPTECADSMLVLCSSDRRPVDYVAEMYHAGMVGRVILSGGKGRITKHQPGPPEAHRFANRLLKYGVPLDDIMIEDESSNTGENLLFTYDLLRKRGENLGSTVLVQQPVSERRALYTFKKQWPGYDNGDDHAEVLATNSYKTSFGEYLAEVGPDVALNKLVGEFVRIRDYPEYGYTVTPEEPIPLEAQLACDALLRAGYTKYANLNG